MKLFYLDKLEKVLAILREQLADGWSDNDIEHYWWCLGYDVFWLRPLLTQAKVDRLSSVV